MEKIKNISITNFKSIKHLKINDCNKINVFIGMPNAGKSNILEGLSIFGLLESIYSINNLKDFLRFEEVNELFFESNYTDFIEININDKKLIIRKSFDDKEFIFELDSKKNNANKFALDLTNENNFNLRTTEFNYSNIKIKKYAFKESLVEKKHGVLASVLNKDLSFPFGNNLGYLISNNSMLRKFCSDLFEVNKIKLFIDKSNNKIRIFKEFQDGTMFSLPYNMIADTLQRLIFYKAAIISNKDSVLLFEEPEAHCFEPYILEFTNSVKYDENDNQFFIVTHSDYIIKEFLRDEESKENTNIYLVNNVDGETKVKLLDKKNNEDVFEFGMNIFFNFESLWETN